MIDNTHSLPQRKTPRASFLDYNLGDYFVTVCTKEKHHYFGEISNGVMRYTPVGAKLNTELQSIGEHHLNVQILTYTVMPNHFHAIIRLNGEWADEADATRRVPTWEERLMNRVGMKHSTSNTILATYVGQLKAAITRYARKNQIEFAWQPRYHDHLIRGTRDGNNIAEYIEGNAANWSKDCFY